MDFVQQQERARHRTKRFILYFVVAIGSMIAVNRRIAAYQTLSHMRQSLVGLRRGESVPVSRLRRGQGTTPGNLSFESGREAVAGSRAGALTPFYTDR